MFETVEYGPPDPMYDLKVKADRDNSPEKADLGIGIYRNEEGKYSELECVHEVRSPVFTKSTEPADHLSNRQRNT